MAKEPEHVHVWRTDKFPGLEIKSCNCGEMRVEEQPDEIEEY